MKSKIVILLSLWLVPLAILAGENPCAECHEEIIATKATSMHANVGKVSCDSCHPTSAKHMESGEVEGLIPEDMQIKCFSCHTDLNCDDEHCSRDEFTCSKCHSTHEGKGPNLAKGCMNCTCESCHKDVKAQMNFPNHHPVPERKMTCYECHSPHGDLRPSEATAKDVNDLCWKCHTSLQGPYIFEHEPVVEDCRICHAVHGSVADNLLVQNEPFLCLQCHEFHFHAGLEGEEETEVVVGGTTRENPFGVRGFNIAYTTSCTQCHIQIHGSDLPSQSVTSRGRGLTR